MSLRILTLAILAFLFAVSCTSKQPKDVANFEDSDKQTRIDSILSLIGSNEYLFNSDTTKIIWMVPHIDFDVLDNHYAKASVYDIKANKIDTATVFMNEFIGGILPAQTDSIVYYLSCGGSGCFCDIIEFDMINMKQGISVVSNIGSVESVQRKEYGFLVKCYSTFSGESWNEEYDFE